MNIKKTIATGLVGITLIAGGAIGASYATWQTSDRVTIGEINTGHMTVGVGDASRWDARGDNWDFIGPVNLNEFKMVPGNTLDGIFPVSPSLVGQSLRANLSFNLDSTTVRDDGVVMYNDQPTNISVQLFDAAWVNEITPETVSNLPWWSVETNSGDFVLRVTFNRTDAPNAADMDVVAELGDLVVTLTQVSV